MNHFVNFFLLFLYCLFIYWLSDQPSLPVPMLFTHQDKVHHAFAYFIMGLLALRSFNYYIKNPVLLASASLIFCSVYGLFDEWHQSYIPGRYADIADWLADTAGAACSVFFLPYFTRSSDKYR